MTPREQEELQARYDRAIAEIESGETTEDERWLLLSMVVDPHPTFTRLSVDWAREKAGHYKRVVETRRRNREGGLRDAA